jgi:hypothetical protein
LAASGDEPLPCAGVSFQMVPPLREPKAPLWIASSRLGAPV